tara:strand:- start:172 stop:546 length:375 start_codon:yes stop_codon:yes gene_type:complete
MLVAHTNYSIRESDYAFVHLHRWEELSHSIGLDAGRAKDAADDVSAIRRGAWNRMTANFFREGDWEIVCDWIEKHLSVLDSECRAQFDEQGEAGKELLTEAINNRRANWDQFRIKVQLSMANGD